MAIKDYTIEELISRLCYLWSKETKTAKDRGKTHSKGTGKAWSC